MTINNVIVLNLVPQYSSLVYDLDSVVISTNELITGHIHQFPTNAQTFTKIEFNTIIFDFRSWTTLLTSKFNLEAQKIIPLSPFDVKFKKTNNDLKLSIHLNDVLIIDFTYINSTQMVDQLAIPDVTFSFSEWLFFLNIYESFVAQNSNF